MAKNASNELKFGPDMYFNGFYQEGGNATEFDAVFRSHQVKHWKNGKSDVVTMEMTAEIKLGI